MTNDWDELLNLMNAYAVAREHAYRFPSKQACDTELDMYTQMLKFMYRMRRTYKRQIEIEELRNE